MLTLTKLTEGANVGLYLYVEHLSVHLLHGHPTTEDGRHREVLSMPWVAGGHHVLGVEHLLGQLGDIQSSVRLKGW